ncbi:Protein F16F9.4 [Aphelenchoides avenae]|nr:Protein F16F9.4 [Aphelenchus avenae]
MWYLLHLGIKPTRKNIRSVTENRHISAKLLGSEENRSLVDVTRGTLLQAHHTGAVSAARRDLYGLPPAFIATMETDIVRDEGIMYANRLHSFNVPTVWKHYDRGYHGMLQMPGRNLREQLLD